MIVIVMMTVMIMLMFTDDCVMNSCLCLTSVVLFLHSEFAQRLCLSLVANTGSPLTVLDLSENPIEDKGMMLLQC